MTKKGTAIKKLKDLDSFANFRSAFSPNIQSAHSSIIDALEKLMSHFFLLAKHSSIFCALQFHAFFYHIYPSSVTFTKPEALRFVILVFINNVILIFGYKLFTNSVSLTSTIPTLKLLLHCSNDSID